MLPWLRESSSHDVINPGRQRSAFLPLSDSRRACPGRQETILCHYRAVERVIQAMRGRLDESLSLEDMANLAIMSPYHFNRTFRQLTGIPPCQFYAALRLEAARRLLVTTQLSVTEICFEVGYNSLGTFTRRFNELLGLSPRQVRALARSPVRLSALLDKVAGQPSDPALSRFRTGLEGSVSAPEGFHGPVFLGLFPGSIAQGRPLACTILESAGAFRMPWVPDGRYFLMAAGLTTPQKPEDLLLYESALRASGNLVVEGWQAMGSMQLNLRPPVLTDPPILLTFPAVVQARRGGGTGNPEYAEA